jgi:hypothetical protein
MHVLLLVLTYSLYVGVPNIQGADRGHRAHLGRGCEPTGGVNFSTPRSVILSFYSAVDSGPPGGAGAEDPEVLTINVKTWMVGPREVPELKVWERPPST